jgi:preprotein translocase SecF subunit
MNILKNKIIYLSISLVLFIVSLFLIFIPKLNLGIDMTWWTKTEYSYDWNVDIEKIRNIILDESKKVLFQDKEVINWTSLYKISGEDKLSLVVWFDTSLEDKILDEYKIWFKNKTLELLKLENENVAELSYTNIWKSFWDYIKNTAILTLIIAILGITVYVSYAFKWVISWISIFSFSIITIITLFHDVVISSGAYIFVSTIYPEFKIDTFFITALLTILWYSINDTIVIFDRIRANLREFWWKTWKAWKSFKDIISLSINETITRSLYTSLTLLFVLITIFFFWPETIRWFILVMILGTIVWTYSSIFIASPMLYLVNKNKKLSVYKKQEINPEDKIVV